MDSSNYLGNTPAYGLFQLQILAGDGSTTLYDLDYTVSSPTQLLVSVDGIIQEPEYSYSVTFGTSTNKINFSEAPDNESRIFIIYMGRQFLTPTQALSSPHIDNFTGDNSTSTFTMTRTPSAANGANMIVFVNGTFQVYGTSNNYTVSGESLMFNSGSIPASSAKITAIQLAESNNTIGTVADGTITDAKLSLSYSTSTFTPSGTTYQITAGHTADSILVFYNGVCLMPGANTSTNDYSVSETTLTLHFTPISGSNIMVRYLPV